MIFLPVTIPPVNATLSTSRLDASALPTVAPAPMTRLTTPLGKPTFSIISVIRIAESGVISDGFRIMALPAASAGASFQIAREIGKFHATISAQTPSGSRTVMACTAGSFRS